MTGKSPHQTQRDLFQPLLVDFIDGKHQLVLLANKIDWAYSDKSFASFYSNTGQPALPIRFMVGCLLLKRIYNLGDETLVRDWGMNPYMQYFYGQAHFHHRFPCDPSDFVHFRKRIGEEGVSMIFKHSVNIHGNQDDGKMEISDTTVQENNITFPTEAKLAKKIIDKCNGIAKKLGAAQRQTYRRTSMQLVRDTYNAKHPKIRKKAQKAIRKLKTLAGRQLRELRVKLCSGLDKLLDNELGLYERVLAQTRTGSNKVYSLHKPFTACVAKGKVHKQYEFGNKVGLVINYKTLVVTAIDAFDGNPHDSKTIQPLLEQMQDLQGYLPTEIVYDRGGKGQSQILGVKISTPSKPLKRDSAYQKQKKRRKFRRRAEIEPVISHLKTDHRMAQNYLHGEKSSKINTMLAAVGWNFKKMMQKLKEELLQSFLYWCYLKSNAVKLAS